MIIQTFYAGLIFSSRNLLDSAAGGTFMSITLGAATKLLDNMMVNYSEWHTERAPQGKKVNSIEETSSLSDKIDTTMSMLVNSRAHVDPNNVPLGSWEFRDSSHGVAYRRGSTVVTMGLARDCANGDTSVYPGLGPSRVEVKPLLPACFVLTRQ
jgi:hypothetical protein